MFGNRRYNRAAFSAFAFSPANVGSCCVCSESSSVDMLSLFNALNTSMLNWGGGTALGPRT